MSPDVEPKSRVRPGCPSEEALEAHFVRGNSTDDATKIDLHLKSCPDCQRWIREAHEDDALLVPVKRVLSNDVAGSSFDATQRLRPFSTLEGRIPRIDGYEIVRRIGEGGMGVVFEGRQLNPPRPVAIKLIHTV